MTEAADGLIGDPWDFLPTASTAECCLDSQSQLNRSLHIQPYPISAGHHQHHPRKWLYSNKEIPPHSYDSVTCYYIVNTILSHGSETLDFENIDYMFFKKPSVSVYIVTVLLFDGIPNSRWCESGGRLGRQS